MYVTQANSQNFGLSLSLRDKLNNFKTTTMI